MAVAVGFEGRCSIEVPELAEVSREMVGRWEGEAAEWKLSVRWLGRRASGESGVSGGASWTAMWALLVEEARSGEGWCWGLLLGLPDPPLSLLSEERRFEERRDRRCVHLLGELSRVWSSLMLARRFGSELLLGTGTDDVGVPLPLAEMELRQLRIRSADWFLLPKLREVRCTDEPMELRLATELERASIFFENPASAVHDSCRRFW